MKKKSRGMKVVLILALMFVISAIILTVLAGIVWRTEVGTGFISGGVIAVYVISCLIGGFCMGKNMGKQKFFWGMLIGIIYFGILAGVGQLVYHSPLKENIHIVSSLLICGVAGMLGGMLAPTRR